MGIGSGTNNGQLITWDNNLGGYKWGPYYGATTTPGQYLTWNGTALEWIMIPTRNTPIDAYTIAEWNFDEAIGSTSFTDSVGGQVLTNLESPNVKAGVPGIFGSSVMFTNAGGLIGAPLVEPNPISQTISYWWSSIIPQTQQYILHKAAVAGDPWTAPYVAGMAGYVVNGVEIGWFVNVNGVYNNLSVSCSVPSGVWNLFTLTWDGTTLRMYLNGYERLSHVYGTGATPLGQGDHTGPWVIGALQTYRISGLIDKFRVESTVRSAEYIAKMYKDGIGLFEI